MEPVFPACPPCLFQRKLQSRKTKRSPPLAPAPLPINPPLRSFRQSLQVAVRGAGAARQVGLSNIVPVRDYLIRKSKGCTDKMAEKGSSGMVTFIVFGNIVILLSGLALFAETIWATTDPYKVYPILGVTGKDDVFAGGWIAIFCGFSFFILGVFGILAVQRGSRTMVLTYLVLMMIVYIFECASCITSFTHRDYMINSNVIKGQMLTYYSDSSTPQGRDVTGVWLRMMLEKNCCGVDGPLDWVDYSSTFRKTYNETTAPWPLWCCQRDSNFQIINQQGCVVGLKSYVYQQGCFDHISNAINSYTWGISWFGFAILMWTMIVMLVTMYNYTKMN